MLYARSISWRWRIHVSAVISATAAAPASRYRSRRLSSIRFPTTSTRPPIVAGVLATPIATAAQPVQLRRIVTIANPVPTKTAVKTSP